MKIVLLEPEKQAQIVEIENTLKSMQNIVGGTIEATYPWEEKVSLVCHDEGKLIGLELNRYVEELQDIIAGPCFICGLTEDNFGSLTDEQAQRFAKRFEMAEKFAHTPEGIVCYRFMPKDDKTPINQQLKNKNKEVR